MGFTLLVMCASHVHSCANNYHTEEALKLQACEKAGMAYLEHTEHGRHACLNKNGEVIVIRTNYTERQVRVEHIPRK